MGWQDDAVVAPPRGAGAPPAANSRVPATPVAPGAGGPPAASPAPWQQDQTLDDVLRSMTRQQMVDYYRTSKRGDPLADAIEQVLSQPQPGESPEQTDQRLYGKLDDSFSLDGATIVGMTDGASLGAADEIAAGIGGVKGWWDGKGFGRGYDETLGKVREVQRRAQAEHPWGYMGGQVLGGVAQGAAMGPVRSGAPLVTRVGQGIVNGIGQGGGYAFLSGEDGFMNRAERVPWGSLVGGVLGGAAPMVGAGLGWLKGRWKDKGIDQQAIGKVADMLQDTTMSPEDAARIAARQGTQGMIADVNEGMQVATGGTSAAGGAGVIGPRLSARREGAPERVKGVLNDTMGKYYGPQALKDAITEAREPAGPAYELAKKHAVYADPVVAKIDELLTTYGPKSEIGSILKRYREQMLDGNGQVIDRGNIIHGIREQLDDEINKLFNSGAKKASRVIGDVRKVVDQILKDQIPGFKDADRIWSETAKIDNAYQYGMDDLLTAKQHPGQVKAKIDKMTVPEEAAALAGARDSIEMSMSQPTINPAQRLDRIVERNMNKQKLGSFKAITPEKLDRLANELDNETTFMETSNLAEPSRQSRTAPVSKSAEKYWGQQSGTPGQAMTDAVAGAGAGFMFGGTHGAAIGAGSALLPRVREMISSALTSKPSQDLLNATADLLTRQGPQRDKLIQDIIVRSGKKLSKEQAGRAVDKLVTTMMQGLPGTGARLYVDRQEEVGGRR